MQGGTSVANLLSASHTASPLHTFAFSQKWKPVFLIQPVSEDILALKFEIWLVRAKIVIPESVEKPVSGHLVLTGTYLWWHFFGSHSWRSLESTGQISSL